MNSFKRTISAGLMAIALAAFGIGYTFIPAASAQESAAAVKVNYAPIPAGEYSLDPAHSRIGFAVRHLEIAMVSGRFKDFTGTIKYDDKDVTKSSVQFTAKIDSIDTEVEARDTHLKSPDFFDAAKFPEMKFVSTKVERGSGSNQYTMTGDLTIRGVTKQVSFPFTLTGAVKDPWGGTRFGVSAETKLNRKDFGVNFQNALPLGGFDVANEVVVSLDLEAVKAEPKPAAATE